MKQNRQRSSRLILLLPSRCESSPVKSGRYLGVRLWVFHHFDRGASLNIVIYTQILISLKLELSIFSIVAAVLAVSATLMITAATFGLGDLVLAQGPAKFGFNLSGSEEVPPVQTNATGMADILPYTIAGCIIF